MSIASPRLAPYTRPNTALIEIWNYTANKWGETQADRYLRLLDNCFEGIAKGKISAKRPLATCAELGSVRCEHHYIFFIAGKQPTILAIFHEKMDCIKRLKKRLSD